MRVRVPLPSQAESASKGSFMDLETALSIVGGYIYFFFLSILSKINFLCAAWYLL